MRPVSISSQSVRSHIKYYPSQYLIQSVSQVSQLYHISNTIPMCPPSRQYLKSVSQITYQILSQCVPHPVSISSQSVRSHIKYYPNASPIQSVSHVSQFLVHPKRARQLQHAIFSLGLFRFACLKVQYLKKYNQEIEITSKMNC